MLKKILLTVAVILISSVIFVNSRPKDFQVTRAIAITAPAHEVFRYLNSQIHHQQWSPWVELDFQARRVFTGEDSGVGSVYEWSGNDQVGAGISTIIESKESELVQLKIDFLKPIKVTYISEFSLTRQGRNTVVSWTMYGERVFLTKLVGIFIDSEASVGAELEKGLANLKRLAER